MTLSTADKLARRGIMTGSRIAAIVGLSPFAGPMDVYLDLAEGREVEETPPMKRGRLLEDSVLNWYAEDTGATLKKVGTILHPKRKRIGATPDAIAAFSDAEERVVEAKTANWRTAEEYGEQGTDEIPQQYICQAQFEMGVTGLHRADVPVLIGGDDFRIYCVRFDEELFEALADEGLRFLQDHVDKKEPPELDGSESCREWLARRFPRETKPLLTASPEVEELARRYFQVRANREVMETEECELRNRLEAFIGEAEGVTGAGWKITWKTVKGKTKTDFEAICRELEAPEHLIQKYTTVAAGYRRFTPTQKKAGGSSK